MGTPAQISVPLGIMETLLLSNVWLALALVPVALLQERVLVQLVMPTQ